MLFSPYPSSRHRDPNASSLPARCRTWEKAQGDASRITTNFKPSSADRRPCSGDRFPTSWGGNACCAGPSFSPAAKQLRVRDLSPTAKGRRHSDLAVNCGSAFMNSNRNPEARLACLPRSRKIYFQAVTSTVLGRGPSWRLPWAHLGAELFHGALALAAKPRLPRPQTALLSVGMGLGDYNGNCGAKSTQPGTSWIEHALWLDVAAPMVLPQKCDMFRYSRCRLWVSN